MSGFRIRTVTVGDISTNCYICYREGNKNAVITDPGGDALKIMTICRELGVEPEAVLLTHGHFDHIMAVEDIRRSFPEVTVYAGERELALLEDPQLNLSPMFGTGFSIKANRGMKQGETISLAGESWQVIETPGHTAGSVCYYDQAEGVLLSGDTLFAESLGRTDLPTGSSREIVASIREKLLVLPEDTMVYPGHGDATTIGHEKKYNPVVSYRG